MKYLELSRFGRITAAAALLLLASVSSNTAFGQESDGLLKIKNKTQAFHVAALEQVESGDFKLSLKNESDKYITAFRVSVHNAQTSGPIDVDVVCCNRGIAPGAVHPIHFGARAAEGSDQTPRVVIEAVVFDDRTSDGDAAVAAEIEAVRFAEKLQLTRIIDMIGETLASPDADTQAAIDKFKLDVSALPVDSGVSEALATMRLEVRLPDDADGELSRGVRSGLRNGKERLRQSLFQLERENETSGGVATTPRDTLTQIREEYKRIVERL